MVSDYHLKDSKVDVWLCDGENIKSKIDYFFSILSSDEKQRAQRYQFKKHQTRFIISHGFKRTILAKYLNINPQSIQFYCAEKGKPYLLPKQLLDDQWLIDLDTKNLQFNMSHTADLTLLAVTKGAQVGVDIESLSRKTDWQSISKRFFTSSEQALLFALKKSAQKTAFYQLWTRKEAYMKVLGSGLSLAPTEFSLTVPPQQAKLIAHYSDKYKPAGDIFFKQIKLADTYSLYCATLASTSEINESGCYTFL